MAEYIEREAVQQVLYGIANGLSVGEAEALKTKDMKTLYKIKGAKEILDTVDNDLCFIPSADVQPVKRGRWELTNNPSFRKCSECGAWWSSDFTDNYFTNYCPKCGARMEQEG